MRAIVTTVRPATTRHGLRVAALMDSPEGPMRRVTPWDHSLSAGAQHEAAAALLAASEGLTLRGGAPLPGGGGWAFLAVE